MFPPSFARSDVVNKKKKKKKLEDETFFFHDEKILLFLVVFQPKKNLISARTMDQPRCLNSFS